jgi:hypothetical protein
MYKSTPQRIRTSNLRFRRPMLYPIELGVHAAEAVASRKRMFEGEFYDCWAILPRLDSENIVALRWSSSDSEGIRGIGSKPFTNASSAIIVIGRCKQKKGTSKNVPFGYQFRSQ